MIMVKVRQNEPFEKMMRRFKRETEKAGILSEFRKHQRYEKPSDERKRRMNQARRRSARFAG